MERAARRGLVHGPCQAVQHADYGALLYRGFGHWLDVGGGREGLGCLSFFPLLEVEVLCLQSNDVIEEGFGDLVEASWFVVGVDVCFDH